MAEVTVEQLAKVVGAPVERLLKQMQDAGLTQTRASQAVSDVEKQQLLAHLKSIHGDHGSTAEPTKITLKRKTVSKMKVAGGSAGKNKVVNVEVRKKRTYVKREESAAEDKPRSDDRRHEDDARGSRREGDTRGQRREGDARGPRREGDARGPRREGDARGPRREGDARGPRREGDSRPPRREGDSRPPRREGDSRPPRREGDSRPPRREGDSRPPRRDGDSRPPRRDGDSRPPRRDDDRRGPSAPRFDPAAAPMPPADDNKRGRNRKAKDRRDENRDERGRRGAERGGRNGGRREERRGGGSRRSSRTVAPESMAAHGFTKPTAPVVREVSIPETITVAELAQKMAVKAADVIKTMFKMGSMVTINQVIDQDTASIVVEEMGAHL